MKDLIQIMAVFAVILTIIPTIVFLRPNESESKPAFSEKEKIAVYFTESGKTEDFTLEEYMIGSVLAQMPADFDEEALKAQAVLAHTYICRRQLSEAQSPTPALKGALISDDSTLYQSFFTLKAAKEYYGNDYEKAYKKVRSAVNSVKDDILTYKGEPIIVAFHAASNGHTQSAKNAWGEDIPYLLSVDSSADKDLAATECTQTLTAKEFQDKLLDRFPDINFTPLANADSWLKTKTDGIGYVTNLTVCGYDIQPNTFCDILDISSPCFEFTFANTKFTFTSHGFGHLVGMSQYGANAMAEKGSDYRAILTHYFTDTKLQKSTELAQLQ